MKKLLAVLVLVACSSASAANILHNGSFDDPNYPPFPWAVTGSFAAVIEDAPSTEPALVRLTLYHGSTPAVRQSVVLDSDTTYSLAFDVRLRYADDTGLTKLRVAVGGDTVALIASSVWYPGGTWKRVTVWFTPAESGLQDIRFAVEEATALDEGDFHVWDIDTVYLTGAVELLSSAVR